MKKILSIILSVTLLATLFTGIGANLTAVADSTELMVNGGFESGSTGWQVQGNYLNDRVFFRTDGKGHNNSTGYLEVNKAYGGTGVVNQTFVDGTALTDGAWYKLSFWVKNNNNEKQLAVNVTNASGDSYDWTPSTSSTHVALHQKVGPCADWTEYICYFKALATKNVIGITYIDSSGSQYGIDVDKAMYFDDFSLTKANVYDNLDFEKGAFGWDILATDNDTANRVAFKNDATDAHSGTGYMVINRAYGNTGVVAALFKEDTELASSTTYKVEFWAKSKPNLAKTLTLVYYDGARETGKQNVSLMEFTSTSEWTKYTAYFKSNATQDEQKIGFAHQANVVADSPSNDGTKPMYIDDFSITKVSDAELQLRNGDFEINPSSTAWSGATVATEGDNNYAVIADTQTLGQNVSGYAADADNANNFYTLSMKLKGTKELAVKIYDGNTTVYDNCVIKADNTDWAEYNVPFNTKGNKAFRIEITGVGTGSINVDDIKVAKKAAPADGTAILPNGDFEYGTYGWTANSGEPVAVNNGTQAYVKLPGGQYQRFAKQLNNLKENTAYKVEYEFYINEDTAKGDKGLQIKAVYDTDTDISVYDYEGDAFAADTGYSHNAWEKESIIFNSGSRNTVYLVFQANLETPEGEVETYLDNITITEIDTVVETSNEIGLFSTDTQSTNSGITSGEANSAIYKGYDGKSEKNPDTEYTAIRFFGKYTCPNDEAGNPILNKIRVGSEDFGIVSRTINILYPDDYKNEGQTWLVGGRVYKSSTVSGEGLDKCFEVKDNGDGTSTVYYSFLLKNMTKAGVGYEYGLSTAIVYKDAQGNEVVHNGAKLGNDDSHTFSAQAAYNAYNTGENEGKLKWFN